MAVQPVETELTTVDGVPLGARVFESSARADMTVLTLPGIGIPQRVFKHVAAWLAERNARCVTVDYRGIGESRAVDAATQTASLLAWARRDAVAALEFAERQWDEPVVLLAHSFGGQLLGLAEELRRVRVAVLVGSSFGPSRYWDGIGRLVVAAYWYLVLPLASAFFEVLPPAVGFGTPLPRGVAREWSKWGRSRDWFMTFEPHARATFAAFDRPLLAVTIDDDLIAPPRAAAALLQQFSSANLSHRKLAPADLSLPSIGHMGLFRPGPPEAIWQEILTFYRRHLP